jgi:hypothetical protein
MLNDSRSVSSFLFSTIFIQDLEYTQPYISRMAFWVVSPSILMADTDVSEEHGSSIFRIEL